MKRERERERGKGGREREFMSSVCCDSVISQLVIWYCIASSNSVSKIYDKQDDFNFEIVNFSFLDRYVPRSPTYGVYISQLISLQESVLMLMTSTTEPYFDCYVTCIKTRL